ncbi:MAG: transketolase [Deltaproteobacteria bacterium]|nr:transketolase [Deltaproteobacteria bacterium]
MTIDISPELRKKCVDTIRTLAMDGVEAAKSGHPGMPMGMADLAFVLWTETLRVDARDPAWPNRDRFVVSNGHGSMLLYALLHLGGFDLPMSELRRFRQLGSRTPGHPEHGHAPGVETTTGPLGQGIGNAVGMALGARMAAARFPAEGGFSPIDHRVVCLAGDGCMMEGVASEAASLAGHLGLGNLVVVYDDNLITIDGATKLAFTEDVCKRYEAYGWHTQRVDGHDAGAVSAAVSAAIAVGDRPSLIAARTTIGFGSPGKAGSHKSHGAPLGPDEVRRTKEALGWPVEPAFLVPDEVRAVFDARRREGERAHDAWRSRMEPWRAAHPELAARWDAMLARRAPDDLDERLVRAVPVADDLATRAQSGKAIQVVAREVPSLVSGSADLAESNNNLVEGASYVTSADASGRNIAFGVREHGMGALVNGLALHGFWLPIGATFLVFSDYMRPSIRLAALMKQRSVFVFTHDSVLLGEDGPTHQPIEHLWALRVIPDLDVWRPADGLETAMMWAWIAMRAQGPVATALTRQKAPALARREGFDRRDVWRGGYVVTDPQERADAVLIATGSEVAVAMEARKELAAREVTLRVVSMPSVNRFLAEDAAYREQVLPKGLPRASLEAGVTLPWRGIVGSDGLALGIDTFGASAPEKQLREAFGLNGKAVAERVADWLGR